jgi:hypothetical protein
MDKRDNEGITADSRQAGCAGECGECPMAEFARPPEGGFTGGAFAIAAVGAFLLPLAVALTAAAIAGAGAAQLPAAVAGILVSVPPALLVNRWARRGMSRCPSDDGVPPARAGKEIS